MLGGYEWGAASVAVVVLFAVGISYFVYLKRRYPAATDADKAFWKLYIMTIGFGVLLVFGKFYLPHHVYPVHIYSSDTQESKVDKLVETASEQLEAINSVNGTLEFTLYGIGMYLIGVSGLLWTIRKSRHEELLRQDPELKTPLGL